MKKVRKANVITALSLTVVMLVAMTGIAVADPAEMDINPNFISNPLDDSTVTTAEVVVTEINYAAHGDSHVRTISVMTDNPTLYAKVSGNGADTGWTTNVLQGDSWAADGGDYTFMLEVRGTAAGEVTVYDNAGTTWNVFAGFDSAHASANTDIPEFATIAIPVGAILGLVLFFNHRKRKKE